MRIQIIKPGLLSTIQDMGRWGHLADGVPVSGAMDTLSARIANLSVGNTVDAAVIEFTYGDAELRATADLLIAYSGDGALFKAEETDLPADRPLFIPAGTNIRLINNPTAIRTYLAVAGGWDVPDVLGSKSTYTPAKFGGHQGRALQAGDVIQADGGLSDTSTSIYRTLKGDTVNYPPWSVAHRLLRSGNRKTIRVVPAHEFTWFDGESLVNLLSTPYTVSVSSNRMGYRLEGKSVRRLVKEEMLSTAVAPGTIQVTGDGKLVLLMADCQTTGGYPRVAQVAAVDIPLCAQLKPGDRIHFKEISRNDAEKFYIHQEKQLRKLSVALTLTTTT